MPMSKEDVLKKTHKKSREFEIILSFYIKPTSHDDIHTYCRRIAVVEVANNH